MVIRPVNIYLNMFEDAKYEIIFKKHYTTENEENSDEMYAFVMRTNEWTYWSNNVLACYVYLNCFKS